MPGHSWGTAQMSSFPMRRLPVAAYFRVCGREIIYLYRSVSKNRLWLILLTSIATESYELAQLGLRSKILTFARAELENLMSPWRMTEELSPHTYVFVHMHRHPAKWRNLKSQWQVMIPVNVKFPLTRVIVIQLKKILALLRRQERSKLKRLLNNAT